MASIYLKAGIELVRAETRKLSGGYRCPIHHDIDEVIEIRLDYGLVLTHCPKCLKEAMSERYGKS